MLRQCFYINYATRTRIGHVRAYLCLFANVASLMSKSLYFSRAIAVICRSSLNEWQLLSFAYYYLLLQNKGSGFDKCKRTARCRISVLRDTISRDTSIVCTGSLCIFFVRLSCHVNDNEIIINVKLVAKTIAVR